MDPIKFSRTAPSEQVFYRILQAEPKGITAGLAESASELVTTKLRELQLAEPGADPFLQFIRLARAYPSAVRCIFQNFTQGSAPDAVVAEQYAQEEA